MKVLVANRGEVALRVFRTARAMGLGCAAVFSEADTRAPFVRQADVAIPIGPAPAADSYLRIDRILDAAKEAEASLIHPGYGFLAEEAEFAEACEAAGFTFVGPAPETLRLLGAKDEARRLAEGAGVPVAPGYSGEDQSDEAFQAAADDIGFPVIVKPAGGGGGKGMLVVTSAEDLNDALSSARRIGAAAFSSDRLLLERYFEDTRHVEVQIFGDGGKKVIHIGERDCSLQRRHQKVLEECPAPNLDDEIRTRLWEWAVALGKAASYRSAGTCEFLVGGDGSVGFLEVNARLQVEHPVTEQVYGVDLVEMQLRLALGEKLRLDQKELQPRGHAVQVRLYAEDPDEDFLPQTGTVELLRWPEGVRIDSGVEEGSELTPHYDPMVAKVIVTGKDRAAALGELRRSLQATEILGVRTNLALLRELSAHDAIAEGKVTTRWLEEFARGRRRPEELPAQVSALAAAAEAAYLQESGGGPDPWRRLVGWRLGGPRPLPVVLRPHEQEVVLEVSGGDPFQVAGHSIERTDGRGRFLVDGRPARAARGEDRWFVWWEEVHYEIPIGPRERTATEAVADHLDAPLPGQVIAVHVSAGDRVEAGEALVVVEAMKMEHTIRAPSDGVVPAVHCSAGQQVDRGQRLVDFEGE